MTQERVSEWTAIPVKSLLIALDNDPFSQHRINEQMVRDALLHGTYHEAHESYSNGLDGCATYRDSDWHAKRVAYLVQYGWDAPIILDVGIPSLGYVPYPLLDGHHRLCAAIIRGDKTIRAEVS